MQAGQDPAVSVGIQQGQRETLVAAGLLERVVAHEADSTEGLATGRFQDIGPGSQVVDVLGDREDLVQVRIQDGFQTAAIDTPGQATKSAIEGADPPPEYDDDDEQPDDRDGEHDDDGTEYWADDGVEIDDGDPPAGGRNPSRASTSAT